VLLLVLVGVVLWGILRDTERPKLTVLDGGYWAGVKRQDDRQTGAFN
jgi:hypothetical protein